MKVGKAVIGANYGDEGKGLFTDYFASLYPSDSVVVRINGGAQAGHTVVDSRTGKRHVFSHFGAGSFLEVPTFLSQFFIVNPIMFCLEEDELIAKGLNPNVTISSDALISTPIDMIINQMIETTRGKTRHGSCGLGINETVTRCLDNPKYKTQIKDLFTLNQFRKKVNLIKEDWFTKRLEALALENSKRKNSIELAKLPSKEEDLDQMLNRYFDDIERMLDSIKIDDCLPTKPMTIFEGAQGLLLDEERMDLFPHLTRSKTGIANALKLCQQFEIDELEVTYVSRSYLTRHGAGPLADECNLGIEDETNKTNNYQGKLRFAPLNIEQLFQSINIDLNKSLFSNCNLEYNLAITCLDQHPVPEELNRMISYRSYGPERNAVESSLERQLVALSKPVCAQR